MRLAVYTDHTYLQADGRIYTDRAFPLFLAGLRRHLDRLVLIGRRSPAGAFAPYEFGSDVELLPLPHYPRLSRPLKALASLGRSLGLFWRSLDTVDCLLLFGPHPFALVFALLALARRRRVVLGIRQDMPAYVRSRHPRRPLLWLAAWLLEGAFRLLGMFVPVVVVGPELRAHYRRSRTLLEITVALIGERDLVSAETALERPYDGELTVLAVGRLEQEKNPLLLAETLALLNREARRWRLVVCGEGLLSEALQNRLDALGQGGQAELRGYVPFGEELIELYRQSHVLLHTSWTEGMPAVLPEAFAAGLPVVAADVGGIAAAVGDSALLVAPGDPGAAADAVRRVADDQVLRTRLVRAGCAYAEGHTAEEETARLARFLGALRPAA